MHALAIPQAGRRKRYVIGCLNFFAKNLDYIENMSSNSCKSFGIKFVDMKKIIFLVITIYSFAFPAAAQKATPLKDVSHNVLTQWMDLHSLLVRSSSAFRM